MGWSTSHELDAAMNITGIKIKDVPHSRNFHRLPGGRGIRKLNRSTGKPK